MTVTESPTAAGRPLRIQMASSQSWRMSYSEWLQNRIVLPRCLNE
ncbi:MAG: hypothetical protein R3F34_16785 [Planctomycetota bacterium]